MAQFSTLTNKLLNNNDTIYEVVMISGQSGPTIYVPSGNLNTSADAFGKLRIASPYTLFDSSFRYGDNDRKWNTKTTGTASAVYQFNEGLIDLTIGTADGDEVIRQTDKVFPYQPGKSLLIMNTFTLNQPKENLRQRVGYFLKDNGIYLEVDGLEPYIVLRSNVTSTIVNNRVAQDDWNVDQMDGTGPSGITIDFSKSQIFWMDVEWLGVGSVRCGFVINGQFIITHIFHHANTITGAYITTASLSCRYEITNTGVTTSPSTMKQICSTVISEGGYQQTGLTRSISTPLTGRNLTNNINNPIISIRLRSGRTEAVVIPTEINLYGLQNTAFNFKIIRNGEIGDGTWSFTDSESSVEYNITGSSISGGQILQEGIFKGQSTVSPMILSEIFNGALQLSRGIIDSDSAGDTFVLTVTPTSNNDDVIASLSWQEKTA
jgi:hypothetical protein